MKPPIIECAFCAQGAYLAKDGSVHCACTPGRSGIFGPWGYLNSEDMGEAS